MRSLRVTRSWLRVQLLYALRPAPAEGDPVDQRETLLRRAAPDQWDWTSNRPSLGALHLEGSEDGLSVYAALLLLTKRLEKSVIVDSKPGFGVVSFLAATEALAACSSIHSPDPDDDASPENFAHCLVIKPTQISKPDWQKLRLLILEACAVEMLPSRQ